MQTVQQPADEGTSWAGPVATIAFVLLIVWVVLAGAFLVFVAVARRNKRRRREARLRDLERV